MRARKQPPQGRYTAIIVGAFLAAIGWVYWPTGEQMVSRWAGDPQHTHGYIVPLLMVIVLWFRRESFPWEDLQPGWLGAPVLVLAGALRLIGSMYAFEWLEAGSVLVALAGAMLLSIGTAGLRWVWPAGALLVFALPWPWQLDVMVTFPLRRIATEASTYALQTLGAPALSRGNIIVINDLEIGVVEACSGLGMLMAFFALSTAMAFVIDRPTSDRVIMFLSAAPIGVLMNVVRITVTVFLYQKVDAETAQLVFHDVAGWVMMPLALLLLWLLLWFLSRLRVPLEETGPVPVPFTPGPRPRPPQAKRPETRIPTGEAARQPSLAGRS